MAHATVRFMNEQDGLLSLLQIEAVGRPEILRLLARTLFHLRVQVVYSETRLSRRRLRTRLHVVEFDGAPISEARRLEVQTAIISAVDASPLRKASRVPLERHARAAAP